MALTKAKLIELFDAGDLDDYLTASSPLDAYPVGSIYMSTASTSPAALFGGTWIQWGAGRVPVGIGSNGTTNYSAAEGTGGAEAHTHSVASHTHTTSGVALTVAQMPSHTHTSKGWARVTDGSGTYATLGAEGGSTTYSTNATGSGETHTHGSTGGTDLTTGNGDNRQPYITCYMWKRTA